MTFPTTLMRLLLLPLLLLTSQAVFSQKKYTTVETTTEKALKAYKDGRQYSTQGQIAIALGYYEQALKADPNLLDAKLALAETYVDMRDFFKAERSFEEVLAADSTYAPLALYRTATVEVTLEKYAEAAAHLASFLKSNPTNAKTRASAEKLLASARFAADAVMHPVPFKPLSVGAGINTKMSEYFPSLTADGESLVFTRNEGGDENFYRSERKDSVWQKAEPLDGVNTWMNEGAQALSPDGTWLVFTACNRSDDGSQGSCDLYWSQLKKEGWTKPVPFSNSINSPDWESQPTISADGKTIIFSKGPSGGNGNNDLYITTRQAGGKWTKPEKLKGPVNTGGKEGTPFLHPDGVTLYFASDSLPGMGGVDLFFTRRQSDGSWGPPQNLGYPINTKADEVTLIVSLDGRTGYYATDRREGGGQLDIYSFEMPEYARPQPVTYAKARVTDAATGKPLVAKVDFTDLKTGQSFLSVTTKSDGTFLACLPAGKDYALAVSKEKYFFFSENFNLEETATFTKPYVLDIALQPIPDSGAVATAGKPVVLRNVFFETGSSELRPESAAELDRLAALLQQFKTLRIQLNGHTDNVGQPTFNQSLSENRAKAVYHYLVEKGIEANRLRYKGFGESKPVDTNETDEGRARNRRTEFVLW